VLLRSERRWWPFTDSRATAAATGERRVVAETTGREVDLSNSIGSSSQRPHLWTAAVSGEPRHLPFRWRPAGGGGGRDVGGGYPGNSAKITPRSSSDPVVIDEALDSQQLEVHRPTVHIPGLHTVSVMDL
jgi:hypothetical protein